MSYPKRINMAALVLPAGEDAICHTCIITYPRSLFGFIIRIGVSCVPIFLGFRKLGFA